MQLQQVISLRRAAGRNEDMLDGYRRQVARISEVIGRNSSSSNNPGRRSDIAHMNAEIARLNGETAELHEQIRELCAKLADDDLLWLDPRRASS